jgi:hypothetical protein
MLVIASFSSADTTPLAAMVDTPSLLFIFGQEQRMAMLSSWIHSLDDWQIVVAMVKGERKRTTS